MLAHSTNSLFCLSSTDTLLLFPDGTQIFSPWKAWPAHKQLCLLFNFTHIHCCISQLQFVKPPFKAVCFVSDFKAQWSFLILGFTQWLSCSLLTLTKEQKEIQWCDFCCTVLESFVPTCKVFWLMLLCVTQDVITSSKQLSKLVLCKDNNWRSGMGFICSLS